MDATTLDRLISTLRASLRRLDGTNSLIVTRPGLGYQLADSA
jgi:DNA-binding winged helix-turn-helix (wHTH) protein